MMKIIILSLVIGIFTFNCYAQESTEINSRIINNKAIVTYNIKGGNTDNIYTPTLLFSENGGVNFNICESINTGYGMLNQTNTIVWDYTTDVDSLNEEDLVFSVNIAEALIWGDKIYPTVKIGDQVWMAVNLDIDIYNGSWCYNDSSANCAKYGKLYTWESAKQAANKISGWHLPSSKEWDKLELNLGMSKSDLNRDGWRGNIGHKLKSTSMWYDAGNGDNSNGFNALPGGCYLNDSIFYGKGEFAYFWTASPMSKETSLCRNLGYNETGVYSTYDESTYGYSVRLVKD